MSYIVARLQRRHQLPVQRTPEAAFARLPCKPCGICQALLLSIMPRLAPAAAATMRSLACHLQYEPQRCLLQ